MFRNSLIRSFVSICSILAILAVMIVASAISSAQSNSEMKTLRLEVAGNGTTMVVMDKPVNEDGLPLHGNPFIIKGYLYPEGTLKETNGVLANGDPEFPDLVIGTWICSGWFYEESLTSPTGPYAVTTQLFEFTDTPGEQSITSYGFEIGDYQIPQQRALTGGTGDYAGVDGQQVQTHIGDNPTGGPSLIVEFSFVDLQDD
jgi:hypothetical protein